MGYLLKNKAALRQLLEENGQGKKKRPIEYRSLRFDNHTSPPSLKEVKAFLAKALSLEDRDEAINSLDFFSDGLSPHAYSQKALSDIELSKKAIKKALGLEAVFTSSPKPSIESLDDEMGLYDQVILTSSGAEAVCQVHFSTYMEDTRSSGKNHILIPEGSPAVFCRSLERLEPLGVVAKFIKTSPKGLCIDSFLEVVSHRTALVSLSTADSLTGALEPIEEIAKICRSKHIPLHIDITPSIGKQWLDFEALDADMITFCGKALGSPFPIGALILKRGALFAPLIMGDLSQEGLRAGGISAPLFKSLEIALEKAIELQNHMAMEVASLKNQMLDDLRKNERFTLFTPNMSALPNAFAFGFSGIKGELLAYALGQRGIFVSMGGGSLPSLQRLLELKGICPIEAATAVSISLTTEISLEEIKYATQIVLEEVERLSSLFPNSSASEKRLLL